MTSRPIFRTLDHVTMLRAFDSIDMWGIMGHRAAFSDWLARLPSRVGHARANGVRRVVSVMQGPGRWPIAVAVWTARDGWAVTMLPIGAPHNGCAP